MKICVFGAASTEIDASYIKAVEAFGEEMAKRGHALVFGAGGNGLMGAAARGVTAGGGEIFGVIPHFFREETIEEIYDKCTELIFTETMAERKATMEALADAFVIVPGGIGTFEEFFQVLTLKQLGRHTKPIAIYDVNGYYEKMEALLEDSMKKGFVSEVCEEIYFYSSDADAVLNYVETDDQRERDVHDLKKG